MPTAAEPARPIGRWTVEVTCPACGGVLAHVADGRPSGSESRAVARCTACSRTWVAEITLCDARLVGRGRYGTASHPLDCGCRGCLHPRSAA